MFVLDGLRRDLETTTIEIPPFHRGHLGFVRDLEVYCRAGGRDDDGSQEFTLTPFQGNRSDLFLLKCVFREGRGVVLKALAALAALNINILSLESATINGGKNHVLFCILSWSTTAYTRPFPMDDALQQKFVRLLPLLPNLDERYLLLLEMLFLFCGEALDHEELYGQRWLPKASMTLFDALQEAEGLWGSMKLQVEDRKPRERKLFVDMSHLFGREKADVILLSETETKTLRLMFPGPARRGRFLHIAFQHENRPGALLAIATLLSDLGFNIVTSLLRKQGSERNVWETILEFEGDKKLLGDSQAIPLDFAGIEWFLNWAFNSRNLKKAPMCDTGVGRLVPFMKAYKVGVSRPSYPRRNVKSEDEFQPQDVLAKVPPRLTRVEDIPMGVTGAEIDARLADLERLSDASTWGWLAKLFRDDICRRRTADRRRGRVFISLPAACRGHRDILEKELFKDLGIEIDSHIDQDSEDIARSALDKIARADFFFALWHPDAARPGTISPWMPFEYGAARALGKKRMMVYHKDLPVDVKRRIDPSLAGIEYDDLHFRDIIPRLKDACERNWFHSQHDDLLLPI